MQTASRIDQYHVSTIGFGALERVESHRGRIATHLLLHHGHAHSLAPDADLLHSGCTERVGGTQIDLLTSLLELPGQFSDRGCLSHAVDADD